MKKLLPLVALAILGLLVLVQKTAAYAPVPVSQSYLWQPTNVSRTWNNMPTPYVDTVRPVPYERTLVRRQVAPWNSFQDYIYDAPKYQEAPMVLGANASEYRHTLKARVENLRSRIDVDVREDKNRVEYLDKEIDKAQSDQDPFLQYIDQELRYLETRYAPTREGASCNNYFYCKLRQEQVQAKYKVAREKERLYNQRMSRQLMWGW